MPPEYQPYRPLRSTPWARLSAAAARAEHNALVAAIPTRLAALSEASGVLLDVCTPDLSLPALTSWLASQVEIRPPSHDERFAARYGDPSGALTGQALTEESLAYLLDAGLYLGEAIKVRVPEASWRLHMLPRRSVDFQRTVLAAPSGSWVSPQRVMTALARGRGTPEEEFYSLCEKLR